MRVRHQKKRQPHYIAAWREYRGLRQYQLADLIGASKGSMSKIENGDQPYTQDTLEAIATALKVSPAALLGQDPYDPTGMWEVWGKATKEQRQQIAELARVVAKSQAVA